MNTSDGRLPVRRVKIIVGVGAIAALGLAVVCLGLWLAARDRHAVDARVMDEVTRQLRRELERLGPDSEIYRRYGQFQTLEGSGFQRPFSTWFQLVGQVQCYRRAVFEKGTAGVEIVVANTGPLTIEITLTPAESFLREHPGAQVVKHGDELWLESPDGGGPSAIYVWAFHPEFKAD